MENLGKSTETVDANISSRTQRWKRESQVLKKQ